MRNNWNLLNVLAKSNRKQKKAILETCDVDLVKCLAEISLNLLKGVIPVNPTQKKKLKRYRRLLHELADKKVSLRTKKEKLNQQGGSLLGLLLPTVLSTLGNLLIK